MEEKKAQPNQLKDGFFGIEILTLETDVFCGIGEMGHGNSEMGYQNWVMGCD